MVCCLSIDRSRVLEAVSLPADGSAQRDGTRMLSQTVRGVAITANVMLNAAPLFSDAATALSTMSSELSTSVASGKFLKLLLDFGTANGAAFPSAQTVKIPSVSVSPNYPTSQPTSKPPPPTKKRIYKRAAHPGLACFVFQISLVKKPICLLFLFLCIQPNHLCGRRSS
jgi:cell division septation protein DedD